MSKSKKSSSLHNNNKTGREHGLVSDVSQSNEIHVADLHTFTKWTDKLLS